MMLFCIITAIINIIQIIMKTLCFVNASKALRTLLSHPPQSRDANQTQTEDWDLQFSTFRSDDYHFYDEFPHFSRKQCMADDSIDQFSYQLESDKESESGSSQSQEKVQMQTGLSFRKFCFRNDKETIRRRLKTKVQKTKKLNFRNNHESIASYFPITHKFID